MKKFLFSMLFAASAFSAAPAFAQTAAPLSTAEEDWLKYIRLDMGFSIGTTKFGQEGADENKIAEIGGLYNVAFGLEKERSRFEIAYQERASVSELISTMLGITSSFEAFSFMANAYYDYVKSEHFAMYTGLGAGAGASAPWRYTPGWTAGRWTWPLTTLPTETSSSCTSPRSALKPSFSRAISAYSTSPTSWWTRRTVSRSGATTSGQTTWRLENSGKR